MPPKAPQHSPSHHMTTNQNTPLHPATSSPDTSIVTIARHREGHLANVVEGLKRQSTPPAELIVGLMQDEPYTLPDTDFPIRQIHIADGSSLPLARARNTVGKAARHEVIAFVDVDCIPGPTLVEDYAREVRAGQGVMMGEVLYLPEGANDPGWTYGTFDAVAQKHCDRQGPPAEARETCTDYRCFWSLNFAVHREDWARSGGFDEGYTGYGGEDTDFGRTLVERDIPIWWVRGARVYHQFHTHAMPPVHHVASVIRNTNRFAEKWGHRTMEHWLYAFREMGLIADGPDGLEILRQPGEAEYALCRQEGDMPYASTNRVLKILEERKLGRVMSQREANVAVKAKQKALLQPSGR